MTHLGCFYFLLFLLLGFISNSRRSESTKCNADRTLIELNSILSMIRLVFASVCPRGPSIFEVSQMLDRRAALSLLLPQPRDRQDAKCSAFSREMGTGKID